jgi:hypothetical protein
MGDEWEKCLLSGIRDNTTLLELNLSDNRIFQLDTQKKLLDDILRLNMSLMYVNIFNTDGMSYRDEWSDFMSEYNSYITMKHVINKVDTDCCMEYNSSDVFIRYTKIEEDHRSSIINSNKIDDCTKEFLIACEYGDYNTVLKTIKLVNIHHEDDYALRFSCRNGHKNIVMLLIVNDANVNAADDTPIYVAAKFGHIEIVKYLILHGANISTDIETLNLCLKLGGFELLELYLNISMLEPSQYRQDFIQNAFKLACNKSYVNVARFLINNYYVEVNNILEIENLSTLDLNILPLLLRTKIKFPTDKIFKSLVLNKHLDIIRDIINNDYKDIPIARGIVDNIFYHACILRYKDAIDLLLDHIILNNFTAKSIVQLSYNADMFTYVENVLNKNQTYMSDNVAV